LISLQDELVITYPNAPESAVSGALQLGRQLGLRTYSIECPAAADAGAPTFSLASFKGWVPRQHSTEEFTVIATEAKGAEEESREEDWDEVKGKGGVRERKQSLAARGERSTAATSSAPRPQQLASQGLKRGFL
jgi:hypothetical protein